MQKIVQIIVMTLIILGAISLAFNDVGGFFRGGVSANNIAEVNGDNLSVRETDTMIRRTVAQLGMDVNQAYRAGLVDQIVMSEVNRTLINQFAQKNGIQFNEQFIAKRLADYVDTIKAPDQSRKEALSIFLNSRGLSESQLIEMLQGDVAGELIDRTIRGNVHTPNVMVSDLARLASETREIEMLDFNHSRIKDIASPENDTILKGYYEDVQADFVVPETRVIAYTTLKPEILAARIEIADADIRNFYDQHLDSYALPEQRVIEQIVKQSEDAAKAIGDDFSAGAITVDDKTLPPDISQAVFTGTVGDVIGPVKSPLGYHVIRIKEILAPSHIAFDDVKDDIRKSLLEDAKSDAVYEASITIEDSFAAGDRIQDIASRYDLSIQKTAAVSSLELQQFLASLPLKTNTLMDDLQIYEEGEVAPLAETQNGDLMIFAIENVTPASIKPFDSVRGELLKQWRDEQRISKNINDARAALDQIRQGGLSVRAAAKQYDVLYTSLDDTKRDESRLNGIDTNALKQIFNAPVGDTLMINTPKGIILASIKERHIPDTVNGGAIAALERSLEESMESEIMNSLVQYLQNRANISINRPLLDRLYGSDS